jgi:uncharacterized protein
MIHAEIQKQLPLVIKLFEKYKINRAFLFGSAVTDKFNQKSDVDFLVNFKDDMAPLEKGEALLDLQIALEDTLHRNIDLLTESSLKNPYFIEEINEKKIKIYE